MKKTVKFLTLLLAFVMMLQVAPVTALASSEASEASSGEQTAVVQNEENTSALVATERLWRDANKTGYMNVLANGITADANYLIIRFKFSETLTTAEVLADGVTVKNVRIVSSYVLLYVELLNGVHTLTLNVGNENGSGSESVTFTVDSPDTDYPEIKAENASSLVLGGVNEMVIKGENLDSVGEVLVTISMTPGIKVLSVDIAKGYIGSYSWYRGDLILAIEVYNPAKITGDALATISFTTPDGYEPGDDLTWTMESTVITPAEGETLGKTDEFIGVTGSDTENPFDVVEGYTIESLTSFAVGNMDHTLLVKNNEGQPVAGVPVYVVEEDADYLLGVTDAEGKLTTNYFSGKGSYQVYAQDDQGAASFLFSVYCYDSVGPNDGSPYALVYGDAVANGKTFVWMSNIAYSAESAIVRLSSSADMANAIVYNGTSNIQYYHTSESVNRVNTVAVADLTPGVYYYQVGDGSIWSEVKAFTVKESSSAIRFAVTASKDAASLALVADAMASSGLDYDFAVQTENTVSDVNDYGAWNDAFNACADLGDLDVIHSQVRGEKTACSALNNATPYAGYVYGNVFVAVVNYTEDEKDLDDLLDDMIWDSMRVEYSWRVLIINRSPDAADAEAADAMAAELVPAMAQRGGMDLVIFCDADLYTRTESLYNGEIAKINGTTYMTLGATADGTAEADGNFVVTDTTYSSLYVSVAVDETGMAVTVYDVAEDGTVEAVDTFTKLRDICADGEHIYRFGVSQSHLVCDSCGLKTPLGEYEGIVLFNEHIMYILPDGFGLGWRVANGKTYYFGSSLMAVDGVQLIGGYTYVFENCVLVEGAWVETENGKKLRWGGKFLTDTWHEQGGKTYYFLSDGLCAVGTVEIPTVNENGETVIETYIFDEDGALIGKA